MVADVQAIPAAIMAALARIGAGRNVPLNFAFHDTPDFGPGYMGQLGLTLDPNSAQALGGRAPTAIADSTSGRVAFARPWHSALRSIAKKSAASSPRRRFRLSPEQAQALQLAIHETGHALNPQSGEGTIEAWAGNLTAPVARRLGLMRSGVSAADLTTSYDALAKNDRALAARATGAKPNSPAARRWHFNYTAAPVEQQRAMYADAMARPMPNLHKKPRRGR